MCACVCVRVIAYCDKQFFLHIRVRQHDSTAGPLPTNASLKSRLSCGDVLRVLPEDDLNQVIVCGSAQFEQSVVTLLKEMSFPSTLLQAFCS